jgi:NADH dehydrogenase
VYNTLGMMGSLGHSKGFSQLLKVRVRGVLARFVRRTYYLLQMPGWARRLHIMIDWTFALLFRPDTVKISLDCEAALVLREAASGSGVAEPWTRRKPETASAPAVASTQLEGTYERRCRELRDQVELPDYGF